MYGAIITVPVSEGSDCGALFMHNAGYSTMCGHGVIALATAIIEHGLIQLHTPHEVRIDTPAGQVISRPDRDGRTVRSVTFENVAAFVLGSGEVEVAGRQVGYTIAFGGAFYAYVEAASLELDLDPGEAGSLIEAGMAIKQAVATAVAVKHPGGDEDLGFLYGVVFIAPGRSGGRVRSACVFADGELDRSPTGTGVSGKAAIDYFNGAVGLREELVVESIIETRFSVRCTAETRVGETPAIVTEVTGRAFQTGAHRFVVHADDPLPDGFLVR